MPACTPGAWVGRRCGGRQGPVPSRSPAPAGYSYDLVGAGFCRTIHIFYDPAYPGDNYGIFQNLPPGEYRLLENGWERSRVQVSLEAPAVAVWPDHTWPIAVAR